MEEDDGVCKYVIGSAYPDIETDYKCLGMHLYEHMKNYSDRTMQIETSTGIQETYKDVLRRCVSTAICLKKRNVKTHDVVCLCSTNHLNTVVPFIATQFIGAVSNSIDPTLSLSDAKFLLGQIKPKIVFASPDGLKLMEDALRELEVNAEIVVFGEGGEHSSFSDFVAEPAEENFAPVEVENVKDTAIIIFSSGSTGLPKGICLSHYALLRTTRGIIDYTLRCNEIILVYSFFFWVSAINTVLCSIFLGSTRLIPNKYTPADVWHSLKTYMVTFMLCPPVILLEASMHKPEEPVVSPDLRILVGGAPISETQIVIIRECFSNTSVFQAFGMTELSGVVTAFNVNDERHFGLSQTKKNACGMPFMNKRYKIVDLQTGKSVGCGQTGELHLKSEELMNGYYNLDSSECFDDHGWFKTGDIVRYDEDFCFYHVGRTKEVFKYRRWQIIPSMIETVIKTHPAVLNAVVIGIPHPIEGEHPMAIVVLREGVEDVSAEDIARFTDEQTDNYKKLRAGVRIVDGFPLNSIGKIDRNKLRHLAIENKL